MILIIQRIQKETINQTMNKEFIQKDFLISFMQIFNNYLDKKDYLNNKFYTKIDFL